MLFELGRWLPIASLVGIFAGCASALLLWSLDLATRLREAHTWLIFLLAPAGWLVGLMYARFGESVVAGNNLLLEEIHDPKDTIPLRMTPLILIGTFMTHLFGGSAGREGTALQTGASLADQLSRPLRLAPHDRRTLLKAGIAAGFGSVFGTPLAGAVFGLEVIAFGRLDYSAIAPCFLAAFVGDLVTHQLLARLWHMGHTHYPVSDVPPITAIGVLYAIIAGIIFGIVAMLFARLTHAITHFAKRRIPNAPLRPFIGGLLITTAVFALGTAHTLKYLGLGIPTIVGSFNGKIAPWDFAAKTLFTSVTLGFGFKGGEVTPLFYIGATLGNALSHVIPLSPSLLAAMGFVAVFAGAANTPIASTLMAVELFGAEAGAYAGIACVIAYLFSGHAGIYTSQRVGSSKLFRHAKDEGLSVGSLPAPHESPEAGAESRRS
jgi:H+/Cl- antiporter ClcA